MKKLAKGLKNSNVEEVKQLAEAYLLLLDSNKVLLNKLTIAIAEKIIVTHEKTFKKLAEND